MERKVLNLVQQRDKDFIARFCQQGSYMDADGKNIVGVCKPVDANEMLTFMHQYDEMLLTEIKEHKNGSNSSSGPN